VIGLLFKVFAFFAILIGGALVALNATNVWNPGTLSWSAPDRSICERYAAVNHKDRDIQLLEVRWVVTSQNYGWGCYFEFGDFEVETVTPMPEI
jgi:hypothetical protein